MFSLELLYKRTAELHAAAISAATLNGQQHIFNSFHEKLKKADNFLLDSQISFVGLFLLFFSESLYQNKMPPDKKKKKVFVSRCARVMLAWRSLDREKMFAVELV
jgi:formamidopyrimidine-DNA glycosylase